MSTRKINSCVSVPLRSHFIDLAIPSVHDGAEFKNKLMGVMAYRENKQSGGRKRNQYVERIMSNYK
jgi:hypothetical protein